MIEPLPDLPPGVLGFRAVGTVEASDYRTVLNPAVDAQIAAGKKVDLVLVLGKEFDRYSLSALWQDALMEGKPENSWGRVALVTHHKVIGEIVQGLAFLLPAEFRLFKLEDLETAVEWVAARATSPSA
ncbi:STAS/SEC14 domain-containing protein [Microbacterium sp. NPDC019599]|uniref:STAS/SEC14 domain-containing protein n=1 Tax=Microbacterium sp. NPDC019599 TaxID=3154690 RepID=UPI0033C9F61D